MTTKKNIVKNIERNIEKKCVSNVALKKEVLKLYKEFKKHQKILADIQSRAEALINADAPTADCLFDFMYNDFGDLDKILAMSRE